MATNRAVTNGMFDSFAGPASELPPGKRTPSHVLAALRINPRVGTFDMSETPWLRGCIDSLKNSGHIVEDKDEPYPWHLFLVQPKDPPMTTTPTSGAAIQRYKIGYHADEWGQRSSTPSGIPDASGSWVRYADHVTALAAGQATAAPAQPAAQHYGPLRDADAEHGEQLSVYSTPRAQPAAQPVAQQPHRSGCTAGTDEECVQRGCGTNCPAVSPQADSVLYDPKAVLEIFNSARAGSEKPVGYLRGILAVIAHWESRQEPHRWMVPAQAGAVPLDDARRLFDAGWKAAAMLCDREDVVADGIIGFGACPQFEAAFSAARARLEGKP